jgi:hypothetical protein
MTIAENVEFIEDLPLSKQSDEFRQWYNENINPLITLDKKDSDDEFGRPYSFTVTFEKFTITIVWIYITDNAIDWRCSDFNIKIKQ